MLTLPEPILVTGATGFIGASLTRRLVGEGATVDVFARRASDRWRLEGLGDSIREHDVDLRDGERVRQAVRRIRPKAVFHCAIYGGYPSQTEVDRIVETNVMGTAHLMQALLDSDIRIVVHAGSSSEYGIKPRPMAESDLLEPWNTYGAAKSAATLLCQSLAQSAGLPAVTLRLFSAYGPYDEPTRLIPTVIRACLEGRDPDVTSGEQVRDFVFIDDLCEAFLLAAAPSLTGEILNIGGGSQRSVGEVVETIVELCGASVRPRWGAVAQRPFETACWQADVAKARALLGWEPRTGLDEGLARTIAWHRERLAVPANASEEGRGAGSR